MLITAGDNTPRKGGSGITRYDFLLIINKIDIALYVGAALEVMERGVRKMRGVPYLRINRVPNPM